MSELKVTEAENGFFFNDGDKVHVFTAMWEVTDFISAFFKDKPSEDDDIPF